MKTIKNKRNFVICLVWILLGILLIGLSIASLLLSQTDKPLLFFLQLISGFVCILSSLMFIRSKKKGRSILVFLSWVGLGIILIGTILWLLKFKANGLPSKYFSTTILLAVSTCIVYTSPFILTLLLLRGQNTKLNLHKNI